MKALTPKQIAEKTALTGIEKVNKPLLAQLLLGMLAGAYIGFGAVFYILIKSDHTLSFATAQLLCGLSFSLGLILVVVAGGELFTGNSLLTMAWAQKKITTVAVLRNWVIILGANLLGAVLLALFVQASGYSQMNHGKIAETYVKVANAKCDLSFWTAFFRGTLCNVLVCLGVWLAYAGKSVTDKIIGIIFPITAFVAFGFEHSVANMFVLSMGLLNKGGVSITADALTLLGCVQNLIPVLLGNIIGGGVFVGLTYWAIYLRGEGKA